MSYDRMVLHAGFQAAIDACTCNCALDGDVCLADIARAEMQARFRAAVAAVVGETGGAG